MERVIAIDPSGCGCTECMVGEYVPLDQATAEQVVDMLAGSVRNNTCRDLRVSLVYTLGNGLDMSQAVLVEVQLAEGEDGSPLVWTVPQEAARALTW